MDVGEDIPDARRYRSHTYHRALKATRRNSNTFGIFVNIFSLSLNMHQGAVNAKSRSLFPGSAQQPSQKNVESSKDQSLRGGEDRVGFVRNESAPDRKRDFLGCGERSSGRSG